MGSYNVVVSGDKRDQGNPPRMLATPASRRPRIGQPDVTIDVLQDDVLLEIFDFYRNHEVWIDGRWDWQLLLHVCQRWRYIVLASPRRLGLQIECNRSTPTRKLLDIWPPFPISIYCSSWGEHLDNDDILAALQRRNRISQIDFWCTTWWEMEEFASAIGGSFPVLTHLRVDVFQFQSLLTPDTVTEQLPDSFLGGSAPLLKSLILERAPFPALPNLVLSASHFIFLRLHSIPHVGYIPPEAMVTFLLPLHNLEDLTIGFHSPESRPLQMSPPPSTRALLPSLTDFHFDGASEYLVDFIARIDAPMLQRFSMIFFSDVIPNISQLHKFIDRTNRTKIFTQAELYLDHGEVQAIFESSTNSVLDIICDAPASPLASMVRLLEQLLTIPSQVERLELREDGIKEVWQDGVDDSQWLQLLTPFVSVKSLYVSEGLGPFVAPALEELTEERVAEVLPKLDNLFLRGLGSSELVDETIKSFVSTRQLSGHPVILRRW